MAWASFYKPTRGKLKQATYRAKAADNYSCEDPPSWFQGDDAMFTEDKRNSAKITSDLRLKIDGYEQNALVNAGADYSVMSHKLAKKLEKVATKWNGHRYARQVATLLRCLADAP